MKLERGVEKSINDKEKKGPSWFDVYIFKNDKFKIPKTTFPRPFLIQTNEKQYGILKQDGLFFTNPDDFEKVKDVFYKYQWLVGEMDNRVNNNSHYDPIHVDYIRETLSQIDEIFRKSKKITLEFISEKNQKDNPEMFYEEYQDYLILINEENRQKVEDYFNLNFGDLSMREQFYFLNFIKNKNEKEIYSIKNLTDKFGTNAFRTFLSIEHGGKEMGDKILALGEKLPEEVARKVFEKYSEYIDVVNNIENMVKNIYPNKEIDHISLEKIKLTLLNKGKDILLSQYDRLADDTFDLNKFNDFIENAKADVDLFKNIFRIVFEENKDTKFEEFLNFKVNTNKSKELKYEKTEEIKEIINRNYKNEELKNAVLKSFENSLNNENTEILTLERDDKVVASARLDFNTNNSVYFGTFNVDPNYCSAKIGNAFFKATVSPYLKSHEVKADCSIRQPISAYYIESGFIGTQIYDYAGEPSLSIQTFLDKEFSSKNLDKDEIIKMFTEGNDNFLIKKFNNQEEIVNSFPKDKLLTRFFYDVDSKSWFALWE